MREPPPISIIIVTKDIGKELSPIFEQSLISVEGFDDVWVINSDGNPNIKSIAERHNATFKSFQWDGKYPKKRQWCLDNIPTKHDWIFFLDADELMFPNITQEISQHLHTPNIDQYAGFFVKGGYIWNGQPLKHGLKNNKIALLHKHRMEYPVINDLGCKIMGEIEGHYQPIPKNQKYKIGQLKTKIAHYAFIDMNDWTKRHQKYAAWEAFMITNKAYPIDPSYPRQCCKNLFRKLPFRGIIAFLHSYVLKIGIIDGTAGWSFAKTRYEYYKLVRNQLHKPL